MDIRLKNNHKKRNIIAVVGLIVLTIITMCFFPTISRDAEKRLEEWKAEAEEQPEINDDLLQSIYDGCYVLYLESMQRQGDMTAAEVYLESSYQGTDEEKRIRLEELENIVNETFVAFSEDFEEYRSEIDYCVFLEDGEYDKNTSQPLEEVDHLSREEENALVQHYSNYFRVEFDENGILTVEPSYSGNIDEDLLIKSLGQMDRNGFWDSIEEEYAEYGIECNLSKPKNFTVVFAVPRTSIYQLTQDDYLNGSDFWRQMRAYADSGAQMLYVVMLFLIAGFVFIMSSKGIWKDAVDWNRPGNWYLMEVAFGGVFCVLCLIDTFIELILNGNQNIPYAQMWRELTGGNAIDVMEQLFVMACSIFIIYGCWYLSLWFIRPVFALGLKEYIRQYSLFYQIFPWMKRKWNKFKHEVEHIDFQKGSIKTIIKVVVIHFIVIAVCSSLWFFGILALIIYSIVLFILIHNYYCKIEFHYQALLRGVNKIAEGDLDTEITEDLGMFEPFKGELGKIRYGFKKAVEEEVKSQRMKTELITNVSHDLKTPLTAITTYVELLKKEDITEEERRSYIDTLEKKSLRLKVLIEDLFEVSKATSDNITLEYMDVDVVNLMKQVSIEHEDKFAAAGLDLRWNVPEEKTILRLDNQKTYRIFENLFVNIQKYGMPNSRVYVDVKKVTSASGNVQPNVTAENRKTEAGMVEIVIKNMSATELNFAADEITERFVRGDVSRNTEGSGLGLAIAKSFTEAQGGNFHVEVDGDLFKVVIQWKYDMMYR